MKYDVIVIGSGPGGYISAVRASQLGLKAAIIEKYATMGGTCLNVGCIPSKALLDSSHHYYDAVKHFEEHGILIDPPKIDFTKMIDRKATVVEQTTGGIKYLMDKNNIDVFEGMGSFVDATHVKITKNNGSDETIEGTNIIIATGSKPASLPFIELDKDRIKKFLDLDSQILYPPVNLEEFTWKGQADYYLSFARLSDAKRVDKIIEAFKQLPDKKLVVIY